MESARKKKIIKKVLKYLLFLSIMVVLLYLSFKNILWDEMWKGLKSANIWWVVFSMIIGYVGFILRAHRWQFIIEPLGYKPSLKNTYDAVMFMYLTNMAVPRMGEVARCGALRKTEKIPFESLLGTVMLERVFDMVCLFAIGVVVVFLRLDVFGDFLNTKLWPLFVERTSGSLVLFILLGGFVFFLILVIVFWKQIERLPFVDKIKKIWLGLLASLKSGFQLKRRRAFLFYTALIWFFYWLQGYSIILAMPETASLGAIDALFLMIVGGLGWVVPAPGGMGSYHFLVSLALLAVYAIPNGIVFAVISHEPQIILMIIFGLISWASIAQISKKKVATEL